MIFKPTFLKEGIFAEYPRPQFKRNSYLNLNGKWQYAITKTAQKPEKFDGEIFFLYIVWYGLGRMFIEGLRTDSLYLGGLRVSQWLAGACLVVAIAMLVYFHAVKKLRTVTDCIYLPESKRYDKLSAVAASEGESAEAAESAETTDTAEESSSASDENNPSI